MHKKTKHIQKRRVRNSPKENAYEKFAYLALNEEFQKDIRLTRRLNKMPEEGFKNQESYMRWDRKNPEKRQYLNQVIVIRKKTKWFSRQYNELFRQYFLYNGFDPRFVPEVAAIYDTAPAKSPYDDRRYWIEIFRDTTIDDIKAAFAEFKTRSHIDFTDTFKPGECFNIDMEVMKLVSQKLAEDKILKVINRKFPRKGKDKVFKIKYLHIRMKEIEGKIAESYKV